MTKKHKILLSIGMVAILSFFLLVVFGDDALLELNRVKRERNLLIRKNDELMRENNAMYNEVERLKHDPEYIENIARKELGMIGKNEIIFKIEKRTDSGAAGEKKQR